MNSQLVMKSTSQHTTEPIVMPLEKAVIYGFTKTMVKIKDIDDGVIVYGEKTIYPDKIGKVFSK